MRIAYGKLGRSWKLDPTKGTATGGDVDVVRCLHTLSRALPNDEFVLVGKNSGEDPKDAGYPANVTNPWATDLAAKTKADMAVIRKNEKNAQERSRRLVDYYAEHVVPVLFEGVDRIIMWLGQHGTTNMVLPMVDDRTKFTQPQDSFVNYASFLFLGINKWKESNPDKDVIYLCPDPRNYFKMRDLKEPLIDPVLAQFNETRPLKHERYGDTTQPPSRDIVWDDNGGLWVSEQKFIYSALELTALPKPENAVLSDDFNKRYDFGMLVNENRAYVKNNRSDVISEWALKNWPEMEIFGKWSDKGMEALGRTIRPAPYEFVPSVLQRWRCTLTTPASGSGWATAKPWECFAHGTVCFFHPEYDKQGHILPHWDENGEFISEDQKFLSKWLRVTSPDQLKRRVDYLCNNEEVWRNLIETQRRYYENRYHQTQGGTYMIQERLAR